MIQQFSNCEYQLHSKLNLCIRSRFDLRRSLGSSRVPFREETVRGRGGRMSAGSFPETGAANRAYTRRECSYIFFATHNWVNWLSAGVSFHVRFQNSTTSRAYKTKTFQSDLLHVKRISMKNTHYYETMFNNGQVFSYSFSQLFPLLISVN